MIACAPTFAVCIAAAAVAAPFEDTQKRFNLELPSGWSFAPQPGDVTGVTFQRKHQDYLATFSVRMMRVGSATTLDELVRRISATLVSEPGFRIVEEQHVRLAGLSTRRRRYVVEIPNTKLAKMGDQWFAVEAGTGYIVHAETLADGFGRFEEDFRALTGSLRFAGINANAPDPHPAALVGRWVMVGAEDTFFLLKDDGTFDLAGTPGVWRIEGKDFMTRPLNGGAENFRWSLQGGQLGFENANLGRPMRYRKLSGGADLPSPPPFTGGAAVAPAAVAPAVDSAGVPATGLEGSWSAKGYALELIAGGAAVLNGDAGTFSLADGLLVLRLDTTKKKKKAQRLVVSYQLAEGKLTLSEDRFGKGVAFTRK